MAATIEGKGQVAAHAQQLSAGAGKHLTSATPVMLMGSLLTPAQITSKLQSIVTGVDCARIS